MLIVFRTDANAQIGTGHLMRCLALADALTACGAKCLFLSRGTSLDALTAQIAASGHALLVLPAAGNSVVSARSDDPRRPAYANWLPGDWELDARATRAVIAKLTRPDWLAVDHYALDANWHRELRPAVRKIMVIDDLADRDYDCDLLLDQNACTDGDNRYLGKVPGRCELLIGPRYALLRDEFRAARLSATARTGAVRRILVSMGGVDGGNFTSDVIAALEGLDLRSVEVDVVIGMQHSHRQHIQNSCKRLGYGCHVQTNRMAELMAAADLAVGAGGSMSWERCCLGLPAIVVPVAMNQRQSTSALDGIGAIEMVDVPRKNLPVAIAMAVDRLSRAPARLHDMSAAALLQVDGQGAPRVAGLLSSHDGRAAQC